MGGKSGQGAGLGLVGFEMMLRLLAALVGLAALQTSALAEQQIQASAAAISFLRARTQRATETQQRVSAEKKADSVHSQWNVSGWGQTRPKKPLCSRYSGSCVQCTGWSEDDQMRCGWCDHEKKCLSGTQAGPNEGNCTTWSYGFCQGEPCSAYPRCFQCVTDPFCGWCQSLARCMEGTSYGPILGVCDIW